MSYVKQPFQRMSGQATSVAAGTIVSIEDVPTRGYILRFHVNLASGSGATVAPVLSEDASVASGIKEVVSHTAIAHVDSTPSSPIPYVATGTTLYLKPVPNAGSDNVVDYAIDIWPGEL